MKNVLIAAAVLLASAVSFAEAPKSFQTQWKPTLQKAQKAGKPIYLHFTTTWCHWCREIEGKTYPDPAVAKKLGQFVCASLDCTVKEGEKPTGETKINSDLFDKFDGGGYPFLVMLAPDGKTLLNVISGYRPPKQFIAELDKALANLKEFNEFQKFAAKADKKGYEYNAKALVLFDKLHDTQEAKAAALQVIKLDPKNAKGNNALATYVLLVAEKDHEKAQDLMEQIKKLDPDNKKGLLERVLTMEAQEIAESAGGHSPDEQKKDLEEIAKIAKKLTSLKNLKSPQQAYQMQIFASANLEQWDDAIAAAKKLLALDPKGPEAERIKEGIAQMEKRKAETKTKPSEKKTK